MILQNDYGLAEGGSERHINFQSSSVYELHELHIFRDSVITCLPSVITSIDRFCCSAFRFSAAAASKSLGWTETPSPPLP